MTVNVLGNPVDLFLDSNGQPLQGGSIYIGQPNTDATNPANQITVYQDQALTIPLKQPLKTSNGQPWLNGSQIPVYLGFGATAYSLVVVNAGGVVVLSLPSVAPFSLGGSASGSLIAKEFVAGTDFTGGTTTQLTLGSNFGSGANIWVDFDGVPQHWPDDFTLNGMTLTFTSPIPANVQKVYTKGGITAQIGVPGNGSVGSAQLAPGAVLAAAIQQPATEQLYVGNGAQINRMNDRLFVGDATVNDGAYPTASPDWLSTLQTSTFGVNGGSVPFAQLAVLTNQKAGSGLTAGAQTKYFGSANSAAIAIQGFGYANNSASHAADAWAYYGESHRLASTDGSAYGIEISVVNRGGASVMQTPYVGPIGLSTGIQIDSGNSYGVAQEAGLSPASSAITIVQNTSDNSAPFMRGIIFSNNSLQMNSGIGEAISFYQGCSLQWYGSGGNQTSAIYCQGTSQANALHQVFQDSQLQFLNNTSNPVFSLNYSATSVNYAAMSGSGTGASPIMLAQGADTNIGLTFQMKGTASPAFANTALANTATAGGAGGLPATPAQYFIVYLNGTAFKIPAYNV